MVLAQLIAEAKAVFMQQSIKINANEVLKKTLDEVDELKQRQMLDDSSTRLGIIPCRKNGSCLLRCPLSVVLGQDLWPSNSPDLRPMDLSAWGYLEPKTPSRSRQSLPSKGLGRKRREGLRLTYTSADCIVFELAFRQMEDISKT